MTLKSRGILMGLFVVLTAFSLTAQQVMSPGDPVSPQRIAARRAAVLDFVAAALFTRGPAEGKPE